MGGLQTIGGKSVQAFVAYPGLNHVTTGTFDNIKAMYCHEDGARWLLRIKTPRQSHRPM